MKCKVCERENPEGALFCGNCGSPFEEENSQQTSEVVHTEKPYANEPEYVTDNKSTLTSYWIRSITWNAYNIRHNTGCGFFYSTTNNDVANWNYGDGCQTSARL